MQRTQFTADPVLGPRRISLAAIIVFLVLSMVACRAADDPGPSPASVPVVQRPDMAMPSRVFVIYDGGADDPYRFSPSHVDPRTLGVDLIVVGPGAPDGSPSPTPRTWEFAALIAESGRGDILAGAVN